MNPTLEFYHFETGDSGSIWIRRSAILSIEYRYDTSVSPPKIIPNSCVLHLNHDIGRHRENHVWINESPEDAINRLRALQYHPTPPNSEPNFDPDIYITEEPHKPASNEETARILDKILPPLPPPQPYTSCHHCGR